MLIYLEMYQLLQLRNFHRKILIICCISNLRTIVLVWNLWFIYNLELILLHSIYQILIFKKSFICKILNNLAYVSVFQQFIRFLHVLCIYQPTFYVFGYRCLWCWALLPTKMCQLLTVNGPGLWVPLCTWTGVSRLQYSLWVWALLLRLGLSDWVLRTRQLW